MRRMGYVLDEGTLRAEERRALPSGRGSVRHEAHLPHIATQ